MHSVEVVALQSAARAREAHLGRLQQRAYKIEEQRHARTMITTEISRPEVPASAIMNKAVWLSYTENQFLTRLRRNLRFGSRNLLDS